MNIVKDYFGIFACRITKILNIGGTRYDILSGTYHKHTLYLLLWSKQFQAEYETRSYRHVHVGSKLFGRSVWFANLCSITYCIGQL